MMAAVGNDSEVNQTGDTARPDRPPRATEIVETLEANADQLHAFGVDRVELFGSYARGEAQEGSDIDLLVEFEEGRGLFDDYIGLQRFLEDLFDPEVDIVKKKNVREELEDSILRGETVGARL